MNLTSEAAQRNLWRRQCDVLQRLAGNRFEVGFTTEEGNEALVAADLPTLNNEQMHRALECQPFDLDKKRDHEPRWREILEELGPDVVRARFSARMSIWGDRYDEKLAPNDFIVAWLAEQHALSRRTDARRFLLVALMTFATLVATCFTFIAAWIAAYPIFCRWLPDAWTSLRKLCG